MNQYTVGQKVYFLGWFKMRQGTIAADCGNGYYWIDDEHYVRVERIAASIGGIQPIISDAVNQLNASVATLPTI